VLINIERDKLLSDLLSSEESTAIWGCFEKKKLLTKKEELL